ncbi:MAG TPA: hypothetical protein PKD26_03690 [Pyrinomonadaceae bacterium]|nr:hypothetical protein [Pyrinomonadaceae bacterium]
MKIEIGDCVVVVLHSPREKLLGLIQDLTPAGLFVRAIDLGYFDDWCQAISNGEVYLPMSDCFYPMWRLERMVRDEAADNSPSMANIFEQRTGRSLVEF